MNPPSQTVALSAAGSSLTGSAMFTATGHFGDGHTEDVTSRVSWPSDFDSLHVTAGAASVSAPGSYTVVATAGTVLGTATLTATFSGNRLAPGFDPAGVAVLDGTPTGATTIAYPSDHTVVPPNLSPLPVHITRSSGQTAARLNFSAGSTLNVSYYAACQPGAGTGCYVDLPADLTRLFIAVSETSDVTLTARVGGVGAVLTESTPIRLAWANVPLSGALYYWAPLARGIVPGYVPPNNADNTPASSGAGVLRYDFDTAGSALPQLVYTDRGRSPTFLGSPPATADSAQCVGCHAVSSDGKTMALTIGGSSAPDVALLDLTTLTMTVLDAAASAGVTSMNDINYYKQFRRSGIATETAFGPRGDVMVNMYRSKLFLRGTTASLSNQGEVAAELRRRVQERSVLEPERQVLRLHVVRGARRRGPVLQPNRSQRRQQTRRPDRDRVGDRDRHQRRRACPGGAREQHHQVLPGHQQRRRAGSLRPERVRPGSGRLHRFHHRRRHLRRADLRRIRRLVGGALVDQPGWIPARCASTC